MHAKFNTESPQNEQPQNDHEGHVKTAEGGRVEKRESEEERATGSQEPDLIAIPYRPNRPQRVLALLFGARNERKDDADSEIESVEHDVGGEHGDDDPEPECAHVYSPPML